MKIKEVSMELFDNVIEGRDFVNGGCGCSSTSSPAGVLKPMDSLHKAVPPPFLNKAFFVISWSQACQSFVIWE